MKTPASISDPEEHSVLDATAATDSVASMIEWLRGRGKILIVCHDNPDPDSIAAAVALRHLILMKTGQDAVLSYGGVIGRSENRQMVELQIGRASCRERV